MYRLDVPKEEYLIPAFWLAFLLILNIATTNRYCENALKNKIILILMSIIL